MSKTSQPANTGIGGGFRRLTGDSTSATPTLDRFDFTTYSASRAFSWELDFWGRARNDSRAAAAERMAVLIGKFAGSIDGLLRADLDPILSLDPIDTGILADLLPQRPDLRAVAEGLEAARFRVGALKAQLLPTLSLSGSVGQQRGDVGVTRRSPRSSHSAFGSLDWVPWILPATLMGVTGGRHWETLIQGEISEYWLHGGISLLQCRELLSAIALLGSGIVSVRSSDRRRLQFFENVVGSDASEWPLVPLLRLVRRHSTTNDGLLIRRQVHDRNLTVLPAADAATIRVELTTPSRSLPAHGPLQVLRPA